MGCVLGRILALEMGRAEFEIHLPQFVTSREGGASTFEHKGLTKTAAVLTLDVCVL